MTDEAFITERMSMSTAEYLELERTFCKECPDCAGCWGESCVGAHEPCSCGFGFTFIRFTPRELVSA